MSLNWVVPESAVADGRGGAGATPEAEPSALTSGSSGGEKETRRQPVGGAQMFFWTYQRSCPPTGSGGRTWRCSGCTRRSAWTWWASVSLRTKHLKRRKIKSVFSFYWCSLNGFWLMDIPSRCCRICWDPDCPSPPAPRSSARRRERGGGGAKTPKQWLWKKNYYYYLYYECYLIFLRVTWQYERSLMVWDSGAKL